MKKKLLFISIALPPKNDPECLQAGRYLKYLNQREKWNIQVVTSSIPTLFMPYDDSLEEVISKESVLEVPIYENKYSNFLIRKLAPSLIERPDSKMTFHWQWGKIVKNIQKPDVIYSRSFPLSSSIMALKLKQEYNVPWVMHLSDPWVESPLHYNRMINNPYQKKYEEICFEAADIISFTTKQTLELYARKYPNLIEKFKVYPNVYDPDSLYSNRYAKKNNEIKIVYTGGLANTRNALAFLKGLNLLYKKNKDLLSNLKVEFAGEMDSANKRIFNEFSHIPILKHLGVVSQNAAFELQKNSDVLLVIDSEIKEANKNVFFPSKLLEYMVHKKTIVAITEKGSPVDEYAYENSCITFPFNGEESLARWLEDVVKGVVNLNTNTKISPYYSAYQQANNLSNELTKLL